MLSFAHSDTWTWRKQMSVAVRLHFGENLEAFAEGAVAWAAEQGMHVEEAKKSLDMYRASLLKKGSAPFVPQEFRRFAAHILGLSVSDPSPLPVANHAQISGRKDRKQRFRRHRPEFQGAQA